MHKFRFRLLFTVNRFVISCHIERIRVFCDLSLNIDIGFVFVYKKMYKSFFHISASGETIPRTMFLLSKLNFVLIILLTIKIPLSPLCADAINFTVSKDYHTLFRKQRITFSEDVE